MKKFLIRSLSIGCLLFTLNFCQAQPVITEYFVMKEAFKIDLNDKKVQKTIYAKGILDIVWNATSLILAVTYDPKVTDSKEILRSIQDVVSLNTTGILSQPTDTK